MDDAAKKKILLPIAIVVGVVGIGLLAYNLVGVFAPQRGVVSGADPSAEQGDGAAGEEEPAPVGSNRAVAPE